MRIFDYIERFDQFMFGARNRETQGTRRTTPDDAPTDRTELEKLLLADLDRTERNNATRPRECAPHPAGQAVRH
ncbi:MAG: hypothetical protein ACE5FO_08100 [Parvularculaceae bacterium]